MNRVRRYLYRMAGLACFGLGSLGIVLPLLPTVPLWILAAFLFTSSSPTLKKKIYDHPQFGEMVEDFVERGVLSRRTKYYAIAGACGGTALSLFILQPPALLLAVVIAFMACVVVWLATRPESTPPGLDDR